MTRRKTKNRTGLQRLDGIPVHHAFVSYVCLRCSELNHIDVGLVLLDSQETIDTASWKCAECGYVHERTASLPFRNWPARFRKGGSVRAERFWTGFFRISTEHPESYWKQCNTCGRVLPFAAFSKHSGWGPLERQMECRCCKGAINAVLNPKRTKQQLHESASRRRVADMLLAGENERLDISALFARFGAKCFKTRKPLDVTKRNTWAIDHILPSRYLYPLTTSNAALLSKGANDNKRDRWPSGFYTNNELIELAKITGADLSLLASRIPVVNRDIDVDACVTRFLSVRERSNLPKRIAELKRLLEDYRLTGRLSANNRKLLGY